MIETCTKKKMLMLIGVLLGVSLLILLFEEYVEDNEFDKSRLIDKISSLHKGLSGKDDKVADALKDTAKTPPMDCANMAALKLVNSCIPCSEFETNALKSAYCRETGFYDKYTCTLTNESIYKPCYTHSTPPTTKFGYFLLLTFASSAVFTSFVNWRRSIIERKAYTRLQNFLG